MISKTTFEGILAILKTRIMIKPLLSDLINQDQFSLIIFTSRILFSTFQKITT